MEGGWGWGHGQRFRLASGAPLSAASSPALLWPLFLLSQPGTWLLSVLVSASPFLWALNLAPSVCLALSVWLGLLALSLYPKLFDQPPPLTGSLTLRYPPQEFLKKEFSAENLTFWKACERFQQIPASDTQQVGGTGS